MMNQLDSIFEKIPEMYSEKTKNRILEMRNGCETLKASVSGDLVDAMAECKSKGDPKKLIAAINKW